MEYEVLIAATFFALLLASQFRITSLMRQTKFKDALIAEMEMEDTLSSIMAQTGINRAILSKIHNGGANLIVGHSKKVSVIIEPEDSLPPLTKGTYTAFPIDRHYQDVIAKMMKSDTFVFDYVDKLPYGMYRQKSEGDLLRGVFHFNVGASKTGIYYAFLGTTQDPDMILSDPALMTRINEKVTILRKQCRRAISKKFLP